MANIVLRKSDRSYATQHSLAARVRAHNAYRYRAPGNDVRGWASALNWAIPDNLAVTYRDRSYGTRSAAIGAIVAAIDKTGYPVGVVVRRGSHAWTVLGYRASEAAGDPATRTILGLYVVGPLGSPTDPWPYRYMTVATFSAYFTSYYEPERRVIWTGRYVIVRPEPLPALLSPPGP
jgi:hypothetical protein